MASLRFWRRRTSDGFIASKVWTCPVCHTTTDEDKCPSPNMCGTHRPERN